MYFIQCLILFILLHIKIKHESTFCYDMITMLTDDVKQSLAKQLLGKMHLISENFDRQHIKHDARFLIAVLSGQPVQKGMSGLPLEKKNIFVFPEGNNISIFDYPVIFPNLLTAYNVMKPVKRTILKNSRRRI